MARMQQIVAEQGLDTQRSTMPNINLDMSKYAAMQQAGAAISSAGFAHAKKYQDQQDQLQAYNAERSFQEYQNNVNLEAVNYESNAKPGGENFLGGFQELSQKHRSGFEASLPPKVLPEYQAKLENFHGQLQVGMAKKEVELRNNYYQSTLNADVDGLAATVRSDPSMSNKAWASVESQVELSGLNDVDKAERLQVYRTKINEATVEGYVARGNFDGARDFIEHMGPAPTTLYKPKPKPQGDRTSEAPSQTGKIVVYGHVNYSKVKSNVKAAVNSVAAELGIPLRITSGYRSLEHPIEARKKPGSLHRHTTGTAVDLDMKGYSPEQRSQVVKELVARGATGVGTYSSLPDLIHFDWSGMGAGAKGGGVSNWFGKGSGKNAKSYIQKAISEGIETRRKGGVSYNIQPLGITVNGDDDVEPNTVTSANWTIKNYQPWEFGGPDVEINAPVAAAFDLMTSALGKKISFRAKKDSVKIRLDQHSENDKVEMVRLAMTSGFSGFDFSSDEKGEYVTLRTDTEGMKFTNRPSWMPDTGQKAPKSLTKLASNDATYVPRGNPEADKLMEYVSKQEDAQLVKTEKDLRAAQNELSKEGWTRVREGLLDEDWLDENKDNLSETDYRMLSTQFLQDQKAAQGEDVEPYKRDQRTYVNLFTRALDPKDQKVLDEAIQAQSDNIISKTDFNQIFDQVRQSREEAASGKPAEWKAVIRKHVMDKIKPIDEDDTTYLDQRMGALFELDDFLKEHPESTREVVRKQADEIIKRHNGASNEDKRKTLPTSKLIPAGRYAIELPDIATAAKKLRELRNNGQMPDDQYNTEINTLKAWRDLLNEELKNGK